jgi:hypothetical protein
VAAGFTRARRAVRQLQGRPEERLSRALSGCQEPVAGAVRSRLCGGLGRGARRPTVEGCRPISPVLAGRHFALLDRRAAERQQAPSTPRCALRSDRPRRPTARRYQLVGRWVPDTGFHPLAGLRNSGSSGVLVVIVGVSQQSRQSTRIIVAVIVIAHDRLDFRVPRIPLDLSNVTPYQIEKPRDALVPEAVRKNLALQPSSTALTRRSGTTVIATQKDCGRKDGVPSVLGLFTECKMPQYERLTNRYRCYIMQQIKFEARG